MDYLKDDRTRDICKDCSKLFDIPESMSSHPMRIQGLIWFACTPGRTYSYNEKGDMVIWQNGVRVR